MTEQPDRPVFIPQDEWTRELPAEWCGAFSTAQGAGDQVIIRLERRIAYWQAIEEYSVPAATLHDRPALLVDIRRQLCDEIEHGLDSAVRLGWLDRPQ